MLYSLFLQLIIIYNNTVKWLRTVFSIIKRLNLGTKISQHFINTKDNHTTKILMFITKVTEPMISILIIMVSQAKKIFRNVTHSIKTVSITSE